MTKDSFEENPYIILLISDNQIDMRRIERKLMDVTFMNTRLYNSTSLKDATEHIVDRKLAVRVIILDLRLRGTTDPVQLCKDMVASAGGIPILALGSEGENSQEMKTAVMAAGAADYLNRSHFEELFARLTLLMNPRQ